MEGKRKFERFVIKTGTRASNLATLDYLKRQGYGYPKAYVEIFTKATWIYANIGGNITWGHLQPRSDTKIRYIPNTEFLNNFK